MAVRRLCSQRPAEPARHAIGSRPGLERRARRACLQGNYQVAGRGAFGVVPRIWQGWVGAHFLQGSHLEFFTWQGVAAIAANSLKGRAVAKRRLRILAIDPGSESSTMVYTAVESRGAALPPIAVPVTFPGTNCSMPATLPNKHVLLELKSLTRAVPRPLLAIEIMRGIYVAQRPSASSRVVGRDQLETQFWAGAFAGVFELARLPYLAVTRSAATAAATVDVEGGAKGDVAVRQALIDLLGGQLRAVGGLRCKTCKKAEGWLGRGRQDCPNCKAGHGDTGYETPRGVLHGWTGSHGFAALAVAMAAAGKAPDS